MPLKLYKLQFKFKTQNMLLVYQLINNIFPPTFKWCIRKLMMSSKNGILKRRKTIFKCKRESKMHHLYSKWNMDKVIHKCNKKVKINKIQKNIASKIILLIKMTHSKKESHLDLAVLSLRVSCCTMVLKFFRELLQVKEIKLWRL